jgi:hypothetical protein
MKHPSAPGRFGDTFGAQEMDIKLEELVADGAVKLFLEELR